MGSRDSIPAGSYHTTSTTYSPSLNPTAMTWPWSNLGERESLVSEIKNIREREEKSRERERERRVSALPSQNPPPLVVVMSGAGKKLKGPTMVVFRVW